METRFLMIKRIIVMLLLVVWVGVGFGQTIGCKHFSELAKQGDDKFAVQDFRGAILKYQAAITDCPDRAGEVQPKVLRVFDRIEKLRQEAEEAKDDNDILRIEYDIADAEREEHRISSNTFRGIAELETAKNQKLVNAFYFYRDSFALAYNGRLFGFVNKEGDIVLDYAYERANNFFDPGYAMVEVYGRKYLLDTKGDLFHAAFSIAEMSLDAEAVSFAQSGLAEIPVAITHQKELKVLLLPDNEIHDIPLRLAELSQLKVLNLGGNKIENLPSSIARLKNLEILDISRNQITSLPSVFDSLCNLSYLDVSGNKIPVFPEVLSKMTKLSTLNLSGNQIHRLNTALEHLTNLVELDLGDNFLSHFPNGIGKLQRLQRLTLHGNRIDSLPSAICKIPAIAFLDVGRNRLVKIPEKIGMLNRLITLDAQENELHSIPGEISLCKSLSNLNVENNQIDKLPSSICNLVYLKELRLAGNNFEELPAEIARLENLKLLTIGLNPCSDTPEKRTQIRKTMRAWLPNCEVECGD